MALHDANSLTDRGKVQANVALAFLVLAWFFIALRVWTRTYVIANFGWDDSTMVLAGVRRADSWKWMECALTESPRPYSQSTAQR